MKVSPNAPCPCGSRHKLKRCCGLFHRGRLATPPQLMRARYSAYAIGNVDFLVRTTHLQGPQFEPDVEAWKVELAAYCKATTFAELAVLEHDVDEAAGRAHVTFRADLRRGGVQVGFTERSLFLREDGRWLYHSGVIEPAQR